MINLGDLKTGDIIYKIHWGGGHIERVEICKVGQKIYDTKIARIVHYDTEEGYDMFFNLDFSDLDKPIQTDYYILQFCSDKDTLINLIKKDKEKVLSRYQTIINSLND